MDIESEFSNTGHGRSGFARGGEEAHARKGKKQITISHSFTFEREESLFKNILKALSTTIIPALKIIKGNPSKDHKKSEPQPSIATRIIRGSGNPAVRRRWTRGFPSSDYSEFGLNRKYLILGPGLRYLRISGRCKGEKSNLDLYFTDKAKSRQTQIITE